MYFAKPICAIRSHMFKKVGVSRAMKKEETNDPRLILVTKKNINQLPLID